VHVLGLRGRVHRETRAEHLRENYEIRVTGETREVSRKRALIRGRVFAGELGLDERNPQMWIHVRCCAMSFISFITALLPHQE